MKGLLTFTKIYFISLHTYPTRRAKCDSSWPLVCWFLAAQVRRSSHREMGTARKELPRVFSCRKRIELHERILWGMKVSRGRKRCGMRLFFWRSIISRHDRAGRCRYGETRKFEERYRSEYRRRIILFGRIIIAVIR